mmetsp:Transcript_6230/g.10835  ORF Transcript_6230/g.10835 Transcript_6230/m.10835 type:complete len:199 (-) Transcript_6230:61-657(-)|eukprot:CAMPEP_0116577962 /NCGR_PEP_ID=MMETSP0397-20121206/21435_1 /TAXON_ID=216820 /ORGANISM="Cyclophora tenuis, Strain ECT3854" /LENGTH=198 /DNA_ID=CAMNT_0004107285 /DNA_START=35 /DNA_END=631 /DNA_ORIENTATION=+
MCYLPGPVPGGLFALTNLRFCFPPVPMVNPPAAGVETCPVPWPPKPLDAPKPVCPPPMLKLPPTAGGAVFGATGLLAPKDAGAGVPKPKLDAAGGAAAPNLNVPVPPDAPNPCGAAVPPEDPNPPGGPADVDPKGAGAPNAGVCAAGAPKVGAGVCGAVPNEPALGFDAVPKDGVPEELEAIGADPKVAGPDAIEVDD